jgi:predicted ATPase/transcriptional regulator with XRE-family HTH domain
VLRCPLDVAATGGVGERFGDVLRRRRLEAGLSQEELAERARLSARGISDLERGARKTPQHETVRRLGRALGLAPPATREFEAAARGYALPAAPAAPAVQAAVGAPGAESALPMRLTPLIGRERELSHVQSLLESGRRLVTLTGPGGAGKTSLALEVARALELRRVYADGVVLLELAALADAALLPQTVAAGLGVPERAGQAVHHTLIHALRGKRQLLVLDNCEHVVEEVARLVGALLPSCEGLHVLTTSRESLAAAGETVFRVPLLAVPPEERVLPAQLDAYPAARLFLEHAARRGMAPAAVGAGGAGAAMSPAHARAVAQICRQLDGLPLAIELAAARVGALGAVTLAARLEERFRVLDGGNRTGPPRHQTLRATVDWSHELLSEPERTLFRRLAVFAGGFTLDAAEHVCGDGLDTIGLVARLVEKSLVVAEETQAGAILWHGDDAAPGGAEAEEGVRYRLLETLRVYARELLDARGETDAVAARHAAYYLDVEPALAGASRDRLKRGLPTAGVDPHTRARLWREIGNLRVALRWALDHGGAERGLLLALGPLWPVWSYGGHYGEARRWVDALLAASPTLPEWLRAAAHATAGLCAQFMGDEAEARARLETSVALSRQAGQTRVDALSALGMARWLEGDDTGAAAAIEEGLAGAEAAGDSVAASRALRDLSYVARTQLDYGRARVLLECSMDALQGEEAQYPGHVVRSLACLGRIASLEGQTEEAGARLSAALAAAVEHRALHLVADCLEWLAPVLAAQGSPREAAQLLGAAEAGRRVTDRQRYRRDEQLYQQDVAAIRTRLSEQEFHAVWAEGERMSLHEAVARALDVGGVPGGSLLPLIDGGISRPMDT